MIILLNDFKQYCYNEFSQQDGDYIYQFYRNTIEIGNKSGAASYVNGRKKNTYESSNDRKFKHLCSCVERFEKNYIISSCKLFKEKIDMGLVASRSLNYFEGFMKNQYQEYLDKNNISSKPQKQTSNTKRKPVPYSKPYNHYQGTDTWKNWFYLCPECKEILHLHPDECPKCKTIIDWDTIKAEIYNGAFSEF